MNKIFVLTTLIVLLSLLLGACGSSLTIDVQPPGESGGGEAPAGDMSTTILYGILILAGAAVLIALLSLFRR